VRERLLTLVLAAGALALFYLLLVPKPQHRPAALGLPLSTDPRPDGYLAIWRWLGEEHVPRVSLRYRYGRLFSLHIPPRGNVLILTLPQREPMTFAEGGDLARWLAQGNTALVVAAVDDEPLWATETGGPLMPEALSSLTGVRFAPGTASSLSHSLSATRLHIVPRGPHPLLAGVRHLTAILTLPARSFEPRLAAGRLPLALAARGDDGEPALWLERRGPGQIILCAAASPFANAGIALGDNAALLANIIAWSRRPGGAVIFDDAHGGLTAYYDARKFFADPRLHATLGWIVLVWLAFVLGPTPLALARSRWRPLDESAYVDTGARYLATVVEPGVAARHLIEEFLRAAARGADRNGGAWQALDADARVQPADRRALQTLYARACAGGRVDLVRLQNLLARLRRTLG
jgi:hypothetical protein